MKIATWNVNSLKVRLQHLLDWLAAHQPDAICLQETKLEDANFPKAMLDEAGYHAVFCGQKTYNGVAIVARAPIADVTSGIDGLEDTQKRVMSATVGDLRIVSAYVPNGQAVGTDKYEYKLKWLKAFAEWLRAQLAIYPNLVVLGDYNVAPEDRDIHAPKRWQGKVMCSEPERAAFRDVLGIGLQDSFRLFEQPEKSFTWWDYRLNAYARNWGLRIDHILVSAALVPKVQSCSIDLTPRQLERPSDHAPVIAHLSL